MLEKAVGQILKCGMMMMIWWQQLSYDTIIECGWALWKIGFIYFLCFFMEDVFVRLNIAIVWNKIILLMCICAYIYVYYVCNIILQDVFPDPGTYSSKIELNRFMWVLVTSFSFGFRKDWIKLCPIHLCQDLSIFAVLWTALRRS